MLTVTTRIFPLLLVLLWLAGVVMLFSVSVYGDFDILVNAARKSEIQNRAARLERVRAADGTNASRRDAGTVNGNEPKTAGEKSSHSGADTARSGNGTAEDKGDASAVLIADSYTASKKGFKAVLTFDPSAPDYQWFTMENPALLVVDFQGVGKRRVRRRRGFSSGPVKRVVFGRHPDYLRMVLYFSDQAGAESSSPIIKSRGQQVNMKVASPGDDG